MKRGSILFGAASVVALAALPVACDAGDVGAPCLPDAEHGEEFAGFDLRETVIESRSFQCRTRVCLVNHFQGRVSCPLGQPPPRAARGPLEPGQCQQIGLSDEENAGKACCLPGTDRPVTTPVCGQCKGRRGTPARDADHAVYCSCRCGVADGEPEEPGARYCTCPEGFECAEIRTTLRDGDEGARGKYCVMAGTEYDASDDACGEVNGHWARGEDGDADCHGTPSDR